jgi:hypothetical protein
VRQPRASIRHQLARFLRRITRRVDPADVDAYEEAVRAAFWTGAPEDRPEGVAPGYLSAPASALPATRPPRSVSWPTDATGEGDSVRADAAVPAAKGQFEPDAGPANESGADDLLPDRITKLAVPVPDDLLRTPASVPSVADDFFAGLIRRVEGDR